MTKSFTSLGALATEMAARQLKVMVASEAGLATAAKVIQEDAKARIGEYQRDVGPFPAWESLAPSTVEDRVRQGYTPDDPLLRSGEMRDSIVTEHSPKEAVIGSKEKVAAYQEFGTDRIPPRPFLGPAALAKSKQVKAIIGAHVVGALVGDGPLPVNVGYTRDVR